MGADEIFKELGYVKHDNHPEQDEPIEPHMFVTQDVRQLYYEQRDTLSDGRSGVEHIEFDTLRKNVVCWTLLDNKPNLVPLNMDELKAINKKVEELGW